MAPIIVSPARWETIWVAVRLFVGAVLRMRRIMAVIHTDPNA